MPSIADNNLNRLARTTYPDDFVRQHNGQWDHQAWLEFCSSIEEKGFTPINLDKVGLILEQKKVEYWRNVNSGKKS